MAHHAYQPSIKMKVKIFLEDGDASKVYHVGDKISGIVCITSTTSINIDRLVITFSSTAKTELVSLGLFGSSIPLHKGQVLLFQNRVELFHGPYTLKPDTYKWSFDFRFPRTCFSRRDEIENDSTTYELDQSPVPLPNFIYEASSTPTLKAKCSVSYTLTVSLTDTRGQTSEKVLDLKFRPYPPRGSTSIQRNTSTMRKSFSCRSLRLNSESLNRGPTLMEKLKASIITMNLPYAAFALILTIPTIGIAGRALPITLTLRHDLKRSTALTSPKITLITLRLSLEPKTTTRYWITGRGPHFSRPDKPTLWGHQLTCFGTDNIVEAKCRIPVGERLVVGDHFETTIPIDQVPSFTSLNIERTYALSFYVEVECVGYSLDFTHRVSDFVVLSGEEAPEGEVLEPETTLSGTAAAGDELPAYVA